MKQLTVYDAIRTNHRDVLRWFVRGALERERATLVRFHPEEELRELPKDVRQRERLRLATERAWRRFARERLRECVRAAVLELEADRLLRKAGLRVIQGGR